MLSRKMWSIIFFEEDMSVAAKSKDTYDYDKTCHQLTTDQGANEKPTVFPQPTSGIINKKMVWTQE